MCDTNIRNCNFSKHYSSCTGKYTPFIKASVCRHCAIDLSQFTIANRANHVRWCDKNPKRLEYVSNSNCSQMHTPDSIRKRTEGIKQAWADGKYDNVINIGSTGYKHTEETKELLRKRALASPHRRLVRSIREYLKKDGTIVQLDSSWEEALAIRLDELGIIWSRPGPIQWVDEYDVKHNYFPDFYLLDFDLYLDPKGPYAFKSQINKIKCLTEQIKNLIIITSLAECKKYQP